jgi:hypothetical protein
MPDLEYRFPEAFLEIGKDDDHSYNSLRTTRQADGRLKIDVEEWGINEHGLQLSVRPGSVLELQIFGRCGSVRSETWIKASFSRVVEKEEEEKAQQIEYRGYAAVEVVHDTALGVIPLGQIDIRLSLRKLSYPKS